MLLIGHRVLLIARLGKRFCLLRTNPAKEDTSYVPITEPGAGAAEIEAVQSSDVLGE